MSSAYPRKKIKDRKENYWITEINLGFRQKHGNLLQKAS